MKRIIPMVLILILALSLCVGALAESIAEQPQTITTDEKNDTDNQDAALTEALAAYKALKGSARVKSLDTLKQELTTYVNEGKLTQEQADLILKYYTEHFASRGEKQPVNNGKNDQKGRGQRQQHQNGSVDTTSAATTKRQNGQPTNNGEQVQHQPQGQAQRQQPQNGNQQTDEVDTTSSATTKKGK